VARRCVVELEQDVDHLLHVGGLEVVCHHLLVLGVQCDAVARERPVVKAGAATTGLVLFSSSPGTQRTPTLLAAGLMFLYVGFLVAVSVGTGGNAAVDEEIAAGAEASDLEIFEVEPWSRRLAIDGQLLAQSLPLWLQASAVRNFQQVPSEVMHGDDRIHRLRS